jgi:putative mRNA 3-end processing factor
MAIKPLLEFTPLGLYCAKGHFYIDPWRPVDKAVITHAHGDHAYWGHRHYLTQHDGLPILKYRVGRPETQFGSLAYGETLLINGVKLSFHPAGHIIGSSQVRLEAEGQVWVASGDYKLENDGISTPFESVKCDVFITESTFGLPCFQWEPQQLIYDDINAWWRKNRDQGLTSILLGYSLGKAQRLLKGLDPSIGQIYAHGAVWNVTEIIRQQYPLLFPPVTKISAELPKKSWVGGIVLAPPSAAQTTWTNRFLPYRVGSASGWMTLRGVRRRRGADKGFVLSDHADWPSLQTAIQETGARRVIVTHGFKAAFSRWLNEQGYEAEEANTAYGGEEEDLVVAEGNPNE